MEPCADSGPSVTRAPAWMAGAGVLDDGRPADVRPGCPVAGGATEPPVARGVCVGLGVSPGLVTVSVVSPSGRAGVVCPLPATAKPTTATMPAAAEPASTATGQDRAIPGR